MKNKILTVSCLMALFLTSCNTPKVLENTNGITSTLITDAIKEQKEKTQEVLKNNKSINDGLDSIVKDSDEIVNITQDANISKLAKNIETTAQDIQKNILKNEDNLKTIEKDNQIIDKNIKSIKTLENKIITLEKEKEKSKNEAIKSLYTTISIAFGLGFIAIIAGAVIGFLVNKNLGLTISGVGLLCVAVASAAVFYLEALAFVAMLVVVGGGLICVGLVLLHLWKLYKANVENVQLVQELKPALDPQKKIEFFGDDNKPGLAQTEIQSLSTQKIVDQIKSTL